MTLCEQAGECETNLLGFAENDAFDLLDDVVYGLGHGVFLKQNGGNDLAVFCYEDVVSAAGGGGIHEFDTDTCVC